MLLLRVLPMIQRGGVLALLYQQAEQVVRTSTFLFESDSVERQQTRMRILIGGQRKDVEILYGSTRIGDNAKAIALVHVIKVRLVADLLTVSRYEFEQRDLVSAALLELLQIVVDLLWRYSAAYLNVILNVLEM